MCNALSMRQVNLKRNSRYDGMREIRAYEGNLSMTEMSQLSLRYLLQALLIHVLHQSADLGLGFVHGLVKMVV